MDENGETRYDLPFVPDQVKMTVDDIVNNSNEDVVFFVSAFTDLITCDRLMYTACCTLDN